MNVRNKQKERLGLREFDAVHPQPLLGLDEVGLGCIAGPVYACGVVLPEDDEILTTLVKMGLKDSKRLTPGSRDRLFQFMAKQCVFYVIAHAHPRKVEELGNFKVVDYLFQHIIDAVKLTSGARTVLIDGIPRKGISHKHKAVKKGDDKSLTIAAASVIAKVARDKEMIRLSEAYPGYGWESNKGYGTPEHLEALEKLGATDVHRRHTRPVIDALQRFQEGASEPAPS